MGLNIVRVLGLRGGLGEHVQNIQIQNVHMYDMQNIHIYYNIP